MDTACEFVYRTYNFINYEIADARSQHLPLIQRPFSILALAAAYVLFVKRLGPWLMRDRQPFQLRRVLIAYNCLQVAANVYLFERASTQFWLNDYNWRCEPLDRSTSPKALEILRLVNLFFWLKITDLLDTVFFILRKKDKQITFLHVYHHTLMVIITWKGVKFFPGGHITFMGFSNTFVHAVVYGYYLVSALDSRTVWWKKYVTQLQLFQHGILVLHTAQLLVHNPCGYHLYPPLMTLVQAAFFFLMFLNFYRRAYCSAPPEAVNRKSQ